MDGSALIFRPTLNRTESPADAVAPEATRALSGRFYAGDRLGACRGIVAFYVWGEEGVVRGIGGVFTEPALR